MSIYIDYEEQFTYPWNDSRLNINWPSKEPILSNRDAGVQNAKIEHNGKNNIYNL